MESDRGRDEEDEVDDDVTSVMTTVRGRHSASLLLAAALLSAIGLVAAGRQTPDPKLTIIDFNVVGADGQPVLDLSANDVTLKVGGRPRTIRFFQLVRAPDRELSPPRPSLPPPFATNVVSETAGRDVMVIIDEESIAPGRELVLRGAVRGFVTRLGPADRVTLVSMRQGGPTANLGEGRADIEAAVGRFSALSTATAQNETCRTLTGLQTLRLMFTANSRKYSPTVVLLSGGIAPPPEGGAGFVKMGSGGQCALRLEHFQEAGTAGRALQGNLYVVYAPELTAAGSIGNSPPVGLETLAGALTAQFVQVATTADALTRVARETSVHYLVGYEPDAGERSAAPQRVELQVARERVRVRFPSEIKAPRSTGPAGSAIAPNDMLRVAETHRELPLQAAAFPSRTEDGKIRLVVLFETEAGVKLTRAAVGLYDAKGRLVRWTAEDTDLARSPVAAGITVPAGRYRMRVAAVDVAGRAGTVDTEVAAELTDAPPVKLSGMVLGVADAGGVFSPRLQFSGDSGAFGYLEIYDVPKGAQLKVVQEVANSTDAPALISEEVALTPGATDDTRIAYAGFAIDGLPVGDVVMRALVSVDGKPVARVVRTLRKVK